MDEAIQDILDALRENAVLSAAQLDRIVRKHGKHVPDGRRRFAKKRLLPYYLEQKRLQSDTWRSWCVDADLDARMLKTLQMKPRRTASGVATLTVLTKPWPCANSCVYCPDDVRMPKSYLHDEPACQRAERNGFDPYLQVASRMRALRQMGHATDKVELIVLGGTWMDYPSDYRIWFISELFRALNDNDDVRDSALPDSSANMPDFLGDSGCDDDCGLSDNGITARHERYDENCDIAGDCACNGAVRPTFNPSLNSCLRDAEDLMPALRALHRENEHAKHRVVGLVVETRPDTLTCDALMEMRALGCTKVQLGVQSLDAAILKANGRRETPKTIAKALELARLFGFKTHVHYMVNLLGATPESDIAGYRKLVGDLRFVPDEVKLYPCALVAGTKLVSCYESGQWRPYTEEELISLLSSCMKLTPEFMRVSRMIRDISATDILVGNKKTNLRQMVDARLREEGAPIREMRFREIATEQIDVESLTLEQLEYETSATREVFLQWVTPQRKIAGFLRLSLPHPEAIARYADLPVAAGQAMIREVHVYGFATRVGAEGASAQHHGLGKQLVMRACDIALRYGFETVNVISAVGTREYYRSLGFEDAGLYQNRETVSAAGQNTATK